MAKINYEKEKCWKIKEHLPITARKQKTRSGWEICFDKMTITYDTFQWFEMSILGGIGAHYSYINGEAILYVTNKGLNELEQFTDKLTIV